MTAFRSLVGILVCWLLSGTVLAQTPGSFVGRNTNPNAPPLAADALNQAFATKADVASPVFIGTATFAGPAFFSTPGQVWSGGVISPGFRGIFQQTSFSGSTTAAGEISLNAYTINSDTLHATAANSSVRGWDFEHNGPAGYVGDRAALFARFNQVGTSGNKAAGRATSTMVGAGLAAQASFSEGGTGTTAATSYGLIFGANILASLNSGATNFNEAHGLEINLTAATGSSVYKKTMAQIISAGLDAVKGASGNDVALVLGQREAPGGASPAAYYDTGLQFGDVDSSWAFGPSASLIAAREPQNGGLASSRNAVTGWGVNFGMVEFATAAFQSIGAMVDGSGNASFQTVNVGNWTLSTSAGSLSIASTMQQTATMAIHAAGGGANWLVGDKFTFGTAGVGKVTGTAAGVATAIVILEPDLQATPPGNPVATVATNVSDGRVSGTGLTIDETWTAAASALSLQPTAGGKLAFNGATPIVKATPVGACAGNTGCQAVRDALGNLGLINTGSISN